MLAGDSVTVTVGIRKSIINTARHHSVSVSSLITLVSIVNYPATELIKNRYIDLAVWETKQLPEAEFTHS